jgi:hypothetical protein
MFLPKADRNMKEKSLVVFGKNGKKKKLKIFKYEKLRV